MAAKKSVSVLLTASQDWICPAGVYVVFLTMTGGGSGTPGHFSQGGGAAELIINRPVVVVPLATYPVVVGAGGLKSLYGVLPTPGTSSSFAGLTALPAGAGTTGGGAGHGGAGGGPGGKNFSDGGDDGRGRREACHSVGGCGGSLSGSYFISSEPRRAGGQADNVSCGIIPHPGLPFGGGSNSGGAGAGTLWGGTYGGNDYVNSGPTNSANRHASVSSYGAGAGGTGNTPEGSNDGGNGAPGCVILTYFL